MSGPRTFETEDEAAAAAATALQSITSHARIQATSIPSNNGKSSFVSVAKLHAPVGRNNNKVPLGQYNAPLSTSLRDKNKKKASYSSRRQKHNESESRRRTRIRHKFSELRVVSRSDKKDRYTVLVSAIERLRFYEARLQELEKGQVDYNSQTLSSRIRAQTSPGPASPSSPGEPTKESSPSVVENGPTPISVPRPINPQKDPALLHKIDDCLALKNVGLAMAYISLNGLFIDCNQAFCDLVGFSRKQLLETSMLALTHPNDVLVTSTMMRRLSSGEVPQFEMDKKCVRNDSNIITTHITMASIKIGQKPVFHLCFMTTPPLTLLTNPLTSTSLSSLTNLPELISTTSSPSTTTTITTTSIPSLSPNSTTSLQLLPTTSTTTSPVTLTTTTTNTPSTLTQQFLFQQQLTNLYSNPSITSSPTPLGSISGGIGNSGLIVGGLVGVNGSGSETLLGHSSSSSFLRPTPTSSTTNLQPTNSITAYTPSITTSSLAFSLSQPLQALPMTFPSLDTSAAPKLIPFDSRPLTPLLLDIKTDTTPTLSNLELQLQQLKQFQQLQQQYQQQQQQPDLPSSSSSSSSSSLSSNGDTNEHTSPIKKQQQRKKVTKRKQQTRTTPPSSGGSAGNGGKMLPNKKFKKMQTTNGKRSDISGSSSSNQTENTLDSGSKLKVEQNDT